MITRINESKRLTKLISCDFKCQVETAIQIQSGITINANGNAKIQ